MSSVRLTCNVATAAALLLTSGCSLLLDWSLDGLDCDADRECLEGYSCLTSTCVADYSQQKNEACRDDIQCAEELYCTPELFCQKSCTSLTFYESPADCETYEYCGPAVASTDPLTYEGICKPSECISDGDCDDDPAEICVELGEAGTACNPDDPPEDCEDANAAVAVCLPECVLDWSDGYDDGCRSVAGDRKYCQPVGLEGRRRLVCLDTASASGSVGDQCLPVTDPCRPGMVCHSGTCYPHCDTEIDPPEDACPTGSLCCLIATEAEAYGICVPGDTCPI